MLLISEFLQVDTAQSTGELVPVEVLVLRDVAEGAVLPRAARGPPEEALLLVQAGKQRQAFKMHRWYNTATFH